MKKLTLLGIILVSFLLAACAGDGTEGELPLVSPYVGGTEGVRMEFIEGLPPSEQGAILDNAGSEFGVGVRITNAGEADISGEDLTVELRGILPEQFGKSQNDFFKFLSEDIGAGEELPGAQKAFDGSIIEGQFATLTFDGLAYQPNSRGDTSKTMQVGLCYEYNTQATAEVCLSGDTTSATTDADDREICAVNRQVVVQNSGAPVQITDFKQLPQGKSKVSLIFTIEHVGPGSIFKQGTVGDADLSCDSSIQNQDRNKVYVEIELEGGITGSSVTCSGGNFASGGSQAEGEITLFEGKPRTLTCAIEVPEDTSIYEDLINIDLTYAYGQQMEKTIIIKDSGTEE